MPAGLQGNDDFDTLTATNRDLEYWCEGSSIPGLSFNVTPILRYGYGAIEKKPASPSFTDLNFIFLGDANGDTWRFFQSWMRMMNNYSLSSGIRGQNSTNNGSATTKGLGQVGGVNQSPFEVAYKSEYASDVNIIVYNDLGDETFNIALYEAYPVFLGDIGINWADNNTIMRIPITLTFQSWSSNK